MNRMISVPVANILSGLILFGGLLAFYFYTQVFYIALFFTQYSFQEFFNSLTTNIGFLIGHFISFLVEIIFCFWSIAIRSKLNQDLSIYDVCIVSLMPGLLVFAYLLTILAISVIQDPNSVTSALDTYLPLVRYTCLPALANSLILLTGGLLAWAVIRRLI